MVIVTLESAISARKGEGQVLHRAPECTKQDLTPMSLIGGITGVAFSATAEQRVTLKVSQWQAVLQP